MRISDWSSDVCSSDLKARHLARHGAQAEARIGRIIGGLEPAVVEAEALGRAILQVKLAVVGLGECFARERLREIGVERVGAVEERSEEHTSELQSLMRNSYAVFCLKTQKIQRRNQHNSSN